MNREIFNSPFKDEINKYIDFQISNGFSEVSYYSKLRKFDRFCCELKITEPSFTEDHYNKWIQKSNSESETTRYLRVNAAKNFLRYLKAEGYSVYIGQDVKSKTGYFLPYIYSDDETKRYFSAVDQYVSQKNRKNSIQLPVLFRTLYCCGTRISETLHIKKEDVDLENGILKLRKTKNGEYRYIPMSTEMTALYREFANKCFYLLNDSDYIFTGSTGHRLCNRVVHDLHVEFLRRANIPYEGNHKGPRIHDWRHTMAVKSFKRMVDEGKDIYQFLPVLSAYLGHKNIYATEKYVRLICSMYPYIEEKCRSSFDQIFGGEVSEDY